MNGFLFTYFRIYVIIKEYIWVNDAHTIIGGDFMLLKYSVSNFKSIGHNIEFSMFPLENTDDRFLTEIETVAGKWKILKRGVFFGPNASGKTSFVQSLAYARDYIVKENAKKLPMTSVNQFKGKIEEFKGFTTFQFVMYINNEVYSYGFSLNNLYVNEEWLSVMSKDGSFVPLFDRITNIRRTSRIKVYSENLCKNDKELKLIELIKESFEKKQARNLFLYRLSEDYSFIIADAIYSWFNKINVIYPNSEFRNLPIIIRYQTKFREFLSKNLRMLDTGVNSVTTSAKKMQLSEFAEKYNISEELIYSIQETQNGSLGIKGKLFIFGEEKNLIQLIEVKFKHLLYDQLIPFNMDDESDGTQRLMDLLPIIFSIERDQDGIFIIDELDRSLHTKLSKYFISHFVTNASKQQLLFTAHDVNLLNLKDFRKEEIWFIEKNKNGETHLKPFSDFDLKENQNILKDYLAGRFGAVPIIKEEN